MITANMVKELREQTGAGMLDCKKALTETNGNMEEAVTWLREKGISKAAKKQTRIAAEGLALAKVEGNKEMCIRDRFPTLNSCSININRTTIKESILN